MLVRLIFLFFLFLPQFVFANGLKLVSDAEIENVLDDIAAPLIKQAQKFNPSFRDHVKFHLIDDSTVNAFVIGSDDVFINLGLLTKFNDPSMVAFVIAHEFGHIIAGHITSRNINLQKTQQNIILSTLFGLAISALSPDSGLAIISGGVHVGERSFLAKARQNEASADEIAARILKNAGYPLNGMLKASEFMASHMRIHKQDINPYLMTHPMSEQRLEMARNFVNKNKSFKGHMSENLIKRFNRIIAKIYANQQPVDVVFESYKTKFPNDEKLQKYVLAIAHDRKFETEKSLNLINKLLESEPKNPFLHEMLGEIHYRNRDIKNAVQSFDKALQIDQSLLATRLSAAVAKIHLGEIASKDHIKQAIEDLNYIIKNNSGNIFALEQLAKAHGMLGQIGLFHYFKAEIAFKNEHFEQAKHELKEAKKHSDAPMVKIRDLEHAIFEQRL